MSYMWSEKRSVDIVINALIFLLAMNFLHLGQFLLPIICLIIFVDHKFKFYVNDIKIFTVLCLFAISFCAFSYKLGFYCVMGFCLPMAYYIGSNLNKNEDNVSKIIYLITFGMVTHLILNFIYEFSIRGFDIIGHQNRYDIWLKSKTTSTGLATNMDYIFSLLYFLFIYEKNKKLKQIGIISFVLMFFYELIVGRRAQLFMIFLCFGFSFIIDALDSNNKDKIKNIFKSTLYSFFVLVTLFFIVYYINIFDIRDAVLFSKFHEYGLNSGRIEILVNGIKYIPYHLFGGQEISTITGDMFHDLLLDIYDYAGIVPFILMLIYVITEIINIIKIYKNKSIATKNKILILTIFFVITLQCIIEPIITGSSIFAICSIMIISSFENILIY